LIQDMIRALLFTRSSGQRQQIISADQVRRLEPRLLQILDWDLHRATVWSFLENYMTQGILSTQDAISFTQILKTDHVKAETTKVKVFR